MKPSKYEVATEVAQDIQGRIDAKARQSADATPDKGETPGVDAVAAGSPIAPAALAVGALAGKYERLRSGVIELEYMSRDRTTTRQMLRDRIQALLANNGHEPRG